MKKIIKILAKVTIVFLAVIGTVAILVIAVFFLNSCPGMRWPEVGNSQSLRVDCAALLNKHETGSIPKVQWPQSVQALKPQAVHCDVNCVLIAVSGGGIGAGWGFVVFPNQSLISSERLTAMKIWGIGQEGVFKYQTIE